MMQHEITSAAPLLDASGNLREPGWARSLLPVYCRSQIRAPKSRIKEWDYYLVTDGHIGIALTIADNGYMGLDSVSFLNFDERWQITKKPHARVSDGKDGAAGDVGAGCERNCRVRICAGVLSRRRCAPAVVSHGPVPRQRRHRGHHYPHG